MTTPTGILFADPQAKPLSTTGQPQAGAYWIFYLTGTTTPANVYADGALTTPLSQTPGAAQPSCTADSAGRFNQIYLSPATTYRAQLYSSGGTKLEDTDPYVVPTALSALTGSAVGALLYPQTTGEAAQSLTPSNYAYPPGDVRRYGIVADSSTDNTATLKTVLAANAGAYPVVFYPVSGNYYRFTGRVVVPSNSTININGAALQWTATTATGSLFPATSGGAATRPGFDLSGSSNVRIYGGGGSMTGPSSASYTALEIGIYMQGGALGTPCKAIRISDLTLTQWGYAGILGQFTFDTSVELCHVTGCGYIGIGFLSAIRSRVFRNEVDTITPGTSSNAYGIIHSYDSSNNTGTSRPGSGGETDPYSTDCIVAHNFVHDIPIWNGINWHGGFDGIAHDNNVYNCMLGISLGSAPNKLGTFYGGQNMRAHNNLCDINQYTGAATTVSGSATNQYGIIAAGGTGGNATDYSVIGNTLIGYGLSNFDAYAINFQLVTRGVCQGNVLDSWSGYGVYLDVNNDCIVSGNVFGAVGTGAAGDACIYSANLDNCVITGNMHRPQSGTAAHYGCFIAQSGDNPYVLSGNDFDGASVAPYGQAGAYLPPVQMRGNSDAIPQISIATVTSNTISIAAAGYAKEVLVVLNTSGTNTINQINGGFVGQRVTLYQSSAQTTTFSRTNAKLSGGSNASLGQYSALTLYCYALSAGIPQWIQVASTTNNS